MAAANPDANIVPFMMVLPSSAATPNGLRDEHPDNGAEKKSNSGDHSNMVVV